MNKDYYYILGEINEEKFVINFVFYKSMKIKINSEEHRVKKFSCLKRIFNAETQTIKIYIDDIFDTDIFIKIEKPVFWKINILNCDCHFVPECGLKKKIKTGYDCVNFHLGDQIYLDIIYIKFRGETEEKIREAIYEEYRVAFFEKKLNILEKSFNIMLGDDHDIADESFRESENYDAVFKNVFNEIQKNLRLTKNNFVIYNEKRFILIDNIQTFSGSEYIFECNKILKNIDSNTIENYILTPRIIMNSSNNWLYNIIFSTNNNTENYETFYETLFEMKRKNEMRFTILCGDEHSSAHYKIFDKSRGAIDIFFVGPLNSVIDFIKNDFFIKTENFSSKEIFYNKKHSFIEIERNIKIVDDFRFLDLFSPLIYTWKLLKTCK